MTDNVILTPELIRQYQQEQQEQALSLNTYDSGQSAVGDVVDSVQQGAYEGLAGIADFVGADGLSNWAQQGAQDQNWSISQEGRAAAQKQFFTDVEGQPKTVQVGDAWTDPRAIAMQIGKVIGMNADIIGGGALVKAGRFAVTSLAKTARAKVLAKGGTPEMADIAAETATTSWMAKQAAKVSPEARAMATDTLDYGVVGHMVSAGSMGIDISNEIEAKDFEELATLPEYQKKVLEIRQSYPGMDAVETLTRARTSLAEDAKSSLKTNPTLLTANMLVGGLGTAALERILRGAMPAGSGIATEFTVEGIQGSMEQLAANQEAQTYVDPSRELTDGVLAAGLNEAVAGGMVGGLAATAPAAYNKGRDMVRQYQDYQQQSELVSKAQQLTNGPAETDEFKLPPIESAYDVDTAQPEPTNPQDDAPQAQAEPAISRPVQPTEQDYFDVFKVAQKVYPEFTAQVHKAVNDDPAKVASGYRALANYMESAEYREQADKAIKRRDVWDSLDDDESVVESMAKTYIENYKAKNGEYPDENEVSKRFGVSPKDALSMMDVEPVQQQAPQLQQAQQPVQQQVPQGESMFNAQELQEQADIEAMLAQRQIAEQEKIKPLAQMGDIRIDAYSPSSIVVRGVTDAHSERLRKVGGKFNDKLAGGAGWIFSKKRQTELEKLIPQWQQKQVELDKNTELSKAPAEQKPQLFTQAKQRAEALAERAKATDPEMAAQLTELLPLEQDTSFDAGRIKAQLDKFENNLALKEKSKTNAALRAQSPSAAVKRTENNSVYEPIRGLEDTSLATVKKYAKVLEVRMAGAQTAKEKREIKDHIDATQTIVNLMEHANRPFPEAWNTLNGNHTKKEQKLASEVADSLREMPKDDPSERVVKPVSNQEQSALDINGSNTKAIQKEPAKTKNKGEDDYKTAKVRALVNGAMQGDTIILSDRIDYAKAGEYKVVGVDKTGVWVEGKNKSSTILSYNELMNAKRRGVNIDVRAPSEPSSASPAPQPSKSESGSTPRHEFPTKQIAESYNHISTTPSRAGQSEQEGFERTIKAITDEVSPLIKTEAQRAAFESALDQFKGEYIKEAVKVADLRKYTVSAHVAGGSNFNSKQAARRGGAYESAQENFTNWVERNKPQIKEAVLQARTPEQRQEDSEKAERKANNKVKAEFAKAAGDIADDLRNNRLELVKDTRKVSNAQMSKLLDGMDAGEQILVAEATDKALKDLGGLVKVVGERSNLGKRVAELLPPEQNQATTEPNGEQVDIDPRLDKYTEYQLHKINIQLHNALAGKSGIIVSQLRDVVGDTWAKHVVSQEGIKQTLQESLNKVDNIVQDEFYRAADDVASELQKRADEYLKNAAEHPVEHEIYRDLASQVRNENTYGYEVTVGEALALARKLSSGKHNPILDRIANHSAITGVKVIFEQASKIADETMKGYYNERTKTVVVKNDFSEEATQGGFGLGVVGHKEFAETLTHELIHAVTHNEIETNSEFQRDLAEIRQQIATWLRDNKNDLTPYALKLLNAMERTNQEVLTYGLTNPEVQAVLKQIPSIKKSGTSLFTDFVAAIRKLLGIAEKDSNLLTDIIDVADRYLPSPPTDSKAPTEKYRKLPVEAWPRADWRGDLMKTREYAKNLGKIGALDINEAMKVWKSTTLNKLTELVDNAVDAYIEQQDQPRVHPNATAPEHVIHGVDDATLQQIVEAFNQYQDYMRSDAQDMTNVFDHPEKSDIVRLKDKATVYHKEHGWMTPEQARQRIEEWKQHAAAQFNDSAQRRENSSKVVLSLFDKSGQWSQPWEDAGYQVYRFDIQNDPEWGDVNNFSVEFFNDYFGAFEGADVYCVLAACPCTDFAVSGARHFAAKDEDGRTVSSVQLVHQTLRTIEFFKPAIWALENPVGRIEALGGLPNWRLSFDPNHIGETYTKKTLIWGRFNADLPIAPVEPTEGSKMHTKYGGKSLATKNARSVTPEGFAYSFFMANNAIDHPVMALANKYDQLDREVIQQAIDAGIHPYDINEVIEDPYYMDQDYDAARDAVLELIAERQEEAKEQDTAQEQQAAAVPSPIDRTSTNTIFTDEGAEKRRALLRSKLGTHYSGLDPEIVEAGIYLAGWHIEKGARSFAAFVKSMLEDMGEPVRPYLKSWYMAAKYDPRTASMDGMSTEAEVSSYNLESNGETTDVSTTRDRVEPNRTQHGDQKRKTAQSDDAGSERAGRVPSDTESATDDNVRADGSDGLSNNHGAVSGEKRAKQVLHEDGSIRPSAKSRSAGKSGRSDRSNDARVPAESERTAATEAVTEQLNAVVSTKPQDKRTAVWGDADDILKATPILQPAQAGDIARIEQRFFGTENPGVGYLNTNGTGTGKTFVGLGLIKRFAQSGKPNILIAVPNDGIARQWVKAAKDFFDLNIYMLGQDGQNKTSDAGKGITITSYATFGSNPLLISERGQYDLIITDESQTLMAGQQAKKTNALKALRAMTNHEKGQYYRALSFYADEQETLDKQKEAYREKLSAKGRMTDYQLDQAVTEMYGEAQQKITKKVDAKREIFKEQGQFDTKVLFLSATPFAYDRNLEYAEGYLFKYDDYGDRFEGGYDNASHGHNAFYIQNFGYKWRYHRLERPGAEVDSGLMERQFHENLKKQGVLGGRTIDVDADYAREFALVDTAAGKKLDDLIELFQEHEVEVAGVKEHPYRELSDVLNTVFDYTHRIKLLEAIKAPDAIKKAKEHLAKGRKVVIFHSYNVGGASNPIAALREAAPDLMEQFEREFPGKANINFGRLSQPLELFRSTFGDRVGFYNGNVSAAERDRVKSEFNRDGSGLDVIVVQQEAGEAGISLHDTTGKHQRVIINIGTPARPTQLIQIEGRIYRVGVVSNAHYTYLTTGTAFERHLFASKIATRASTAENLGMGELARSLKESISEAYLDADYREVGDVLGVGGKERDRPQEISAWDRAKTFYWANLKRNQKTKSAEGEDYFATPEPLGQKMVEWLQPKAGHRLLEPSVGHAAIGRWFGGDTRNKAVEKSYKLASIAKMNFNGEVLNMPFEELPFVNKFDGIAMNPPFGKGGKLAYEHIQKALKHLANGGRVIAIVPDGPAANKRLDALLEDEKNSNIYLAGEVLLPPATFERAGTGVVCKVIILDRFDNNADAPNHQRIDVRNSASIEEFFERIEHLSVKDRKDATPKESDPWQYMDHTIANNGSRTYRLRFHGELPKELLTVLQDDAGNYDGQKTRDTREFTFNSEEGRQDFAKYATQLIDEAKESGVAINFKAPTKRTSAAPVQATKVVAPETSTESPSTYFELTSETYITTKGKPYLISNMLERQDKETYATLQELAKQYGGWTRSQQFLFKTAEDFHQFNNAATQALDSKNPKKEQEPAKDVVGNLKKWFGASKVTDSQGQPLRVYHGSYSSPIETFSTKGFYNTGYFGNGAYFTSDTEEASNYSSVEPFINVDFGGKAEVLARETGISYVEAKAELTKNLGSVYPVYLKIENPLVLDETPLEMTEQQFIYDIQDLLKDKDPETPARLYRQFMRAKTGREQLEVLANKGVTGAYKNFALTRNRDGLIVMPSMAPRSKGGAHYVVFYSEQVKSAIGNNGDYDAKNTDIRYSKTSTTKPGAGLPVKVVEAEAARFVKKLNGAAGVKVKVLATQKDAAEHWGRSLRGTTVRGAFVGKDNTVYVIAENIANVDALKTTLTHEIIGHAGLYNVISAADRQAFIDRILQTRSYKAFSDVWAKIDKDYKGHSDAHKAEEVFAYYAQNIPTQSAAKLWWKGLINWIKKALQTAGLYPKNSVVDDMDGMIAAIQRGFTKQQRSAVEGRNAMAMQSEDNSRVNLHYKAATKRVPELQEAAKQLVAGQLSWEEYDDLVNRFKPVTPYETVPKAATRQEMERALDANKVSKIGAPYEQLSEGDFVGLRLDIPSYTNHGVWIVSVHEGKKGGKGGAAGKVIGYDSAAIVSNPNLGAAEKPTLQIAAGASKGTIATIGGSWVRKTPDEISAMAQEAIKDNDWIQVGFDPERHSYFFDRDNMEPVTGGDMALQVGGLVLVKNPVYGFKDDFLFDKDGAQTDNFKRWFSGSKVVDKNGNPMMVYHGSPAGDLSVFDTTGDKSQSAVKSIGTKGAYFTKKPSYAYGYAGMGGSIYPVYLSIKKPLVVTGESIATTGIKGLLNRLIYGRDKVQVESQLDRFRAGATQFLSSGDIDALKAAGYDGIINDQHSEIIVFDPNQIKSAIGNNGDFDPANPDIRFSKLSGLSDAASAIADAATKINAERLQRWAELFKPSEVWSSIKERWPDRMRPTMLQLIPRNYLTDIAGALLPSLRRYNAQVARMEAERNDMLGTIHETADKWRKLVSQDEKTATRMATLMHDATLHGVDPTTDKFVPTITPKHYEYLMNKTKAWIKSRSGDPEAVGRGIERRRRIQDAMDRVSDQSEAWLSLSDEFKKLPEAYKQLFKEAAKSYHDMNQARMKAVEDRIQDLVLDKRTAAAQIEMMRDEFEVASLSGIYFPLQRFGKYSASAVNATTGELIAYSRFETNAEMQKWIKENQSESVKVTGGYQMEYSRLMEGVSAGFMKDLLLKLGPIFSRDNKLQDDLYQLFLEHMPQLSMRKHMIHRKGVAGFSQDALRAYASNQFHAAYQVAKIRHTHHMASHMLAMEDEVKLIEDTDDRVKATQVVNEMRQRNEWILNPQGGELANRLTGWGFFWYLGTSPAAALVNVTQTALVALPIVGARYTYKAAAAEMGKMSKLFMRTKGDIDQGLTVNEKAAHKALIRSGIIDKTMAHDLTGIADGGIGYSPKYHKVMSIAGYMFHKAELFNREVTAMAVYRLAYQKHSKRMSLQEAHREAVREAIELTRLSHFDYANSNRPRFMQSDMARVLLLFRQHAVNMTYRLIRDFQQSFWGKGQDRDIARKQLAGILGMTFLFAGAAGLPLYSVVAGIANTLLGDDDDPFDFDKAVRDVLGEAIGETAASVVMSGAPGTALQVDLTSRIGLNNLWIKDNSADLDGEAAVQYYAEQALGPMYGILTGWGRALDLAREGHTGRAWEAAVPKFARDWFKSVRFADEGALSLRGDPIVEEFNWWEIAMQANGFTPLDLSNQYRENGAIKGAERKILDRRKLLMNRYALSKKVGDASLTAETLKDIEAFNQAQPSVKITPADRIKSLKARAKISERAKNGVILSDKLSGLAQ